MKAILLNTVVKYKDNFPVKGNFMVVGTKDEPYKPKAHPFNKLIVEVEKGKDFIIIPMTEDEKDTRRAPIDGIHVYKSEIVALDE